MTDAIRRLLAAGCAALVLMLGLMAANPVLHDLAHQNATADKSACAHHDQGPATPPADQANNDHVCAVTLFAQSLALAMPLSAADSHRSAAA